ncbi:P-loop containing nucleoside triphosphate hydrolase protein [Nemania serpens]|nr:P-loop containing nucleoside triphosphate hydrolase protein [Nemania serpens]
MAKLHSKDKDRPPTMSPTPSHASGTVASSPCTQGANDATVVKSVSKEVNKSSEDGSSTDSEPQTTESRGPKGFAHPAFTDIGMKMKEYNEALGDIQPLGVSHVAVLPELVLVGDQSSGKSSLMSAFACSKLPRSSGICTRCPFHIRMSSSKDLTWSCTVSLQKEYEYCPPANRPVRRADVTKRNPFPPWVRKTLAETIIFKTIYEHDSVGIDEILCWAQVATLNPSQNPAQFVPGEGSYAKETTLETAKLSTEARFSPNVVSLEMRGPCFPDLSFFDLPGIFAVPELKDDDYLVDVVENLTRKYVSSKGAIIMLALPMDQDMDNSRTLGVVRELNAENRTIGVLTKADRPNFNEIDKIDYWLAVLEEKKQRVKEGGFFMTSLPPEQELDNLMIWEDLFFRAEGKNWPREFDHYAHRCGVDQLRPFIMQELGHAFACSLPNIKERFENRLDDIQGQLNELPDLPRNLEHEVRMTLGHFYTSVKDSVSSQEFEQNCKQLTEQFYRNLLRLKPKCILTTEKSKPRPEDIIMISDDTEDEVTGSKRPASRHPAVSSTPKRQRHVDLFTTPVKTEGSPAGSEFWSSTPMSSLSQTCGEKGKTLSLLEIRKEINMKTRGGFENVVPFEVYESLCLNAVSQWGKQLELYMDSITEKLVNAVTNALESSFKKFSKRVIYKDARELLMALLEERSAQQYKRLVELYENETYRVVTINEASFNHLKVEEKELLRRDRLIIRAKAAGLNDRERGFKSYEEMSAEEQSKVLNKYRSQLPEDEFEREIGVAATVRGYYLTAAARFVDGASMDVSSRLFRSLRDGQLDHFLDEKLGLFPYPSPETYARLMEEDVATAQKREQLKKEQAKLQTALQRILALEDSLPGYTMRRQENPPINPIC